MIVYWIGGFGALWLGIRIAEAAAGKRKGVARKRKDKGNREIGTKHRKKGFFKGTNILIRLEIVLEPSSTSKATLACGNTKPKTDEQKAH